jgi:DNA-directed RNA polymerase specialized sigma24 family protein
MEGYRFLRGPRPLPTNHDAVGVVVDADAFAYAVVDLAPPAIRLGRVLGLRADEAADAVQEAVALAWPHRDQLHGPLRPWFLAIVRLRARRVRRWITIPVFWSSQPAEGPNPEGLDPRLGAALRRLPRRQRAAPWLRHRLDMSASDVARVLGASEAATKQLCLRARVAVRARLLTASEG